MSHTKYSSRKFGSESIRCAFASCTPYYNNYIEKVDIITYNILKNLFIEFQRLVVSHGVGPWNSTFNIHRTKQINYKTSNFL